MIQGNSYKNEEEWNLRDMKEAKSIGCKDWVQMMKEESNLKFLLLETLELS